MASNSFGNIFRYTSWGESHGPAIGCVIDGTPSLISLTEEDIQFFLNKRRPGQSEYTTARIEDDKVEIISGVFEGKTTGTPISLIIHNNDQRSDDYSGIKGKFRPGHADFTYTMKYGIRDYRGGGRSSARETAMRVATGAIARKILPSNIKITAGVIAIGKEKCDIANWQDHIINENPLFCPDQNAVDRFQQYLTKLKGEHDSCGALIELRIKGVPVGFGEPIYQKLDANLAFAMMSINAVKAVEIGDGFALATMHGSQASDEMFITEHNEYSFHSNHSGGINGGISTGQDIIIRVAVKPTSSIGKELKTITNSKENTIIETKGRHDPCVGIRAVPVIEAMAAIVLADHLLMAKNSRI